MGPRDREVPHHRSFETNAVCLLARAIHHWMTHGRKSYKPLLQKWKEIPSTILQWSTAQGGTAAMRCGDSRQKPRRRHMTPNLDRDEDVPEQRLRRCRA